MAPGDTVRAGAARALVGIAQGAALYGLFEAFQQKTWPATEGSLFAALSATAIFVPLIAVSALTHVRAGLLLGWVLIATLICASLGWYDVYRDPVPWLQTVRNLPSPQLWSALTAGLFIAHSLLVSGSSDGRFIARYPTYFGVSWKYGLQVIMAVLFTGAFWLVLWLGAELFKLIRIDALSQLLQKPWFSFPATTITLTYAIHVTDVRVGIVRGVRTLSCSLLSWLLPLLTLIAAGFVAALPFTGLEPLWSTRYASSLLLAVSASLIFLINAAYQDGHRPDGSGTDEARSLPLLLLASLRVAAAVVIALVGLAAYGISLRVGQYGWTPERVIATACATMAACYAVGYAVAAIRWGRSTSALEKTNIVSAFIALAILVALFTPLADPARISVADQLRRLKAGAIAPEKFDYLLLRFRTGRFGLDALHALAERKDLPVVAERSAEALQTKAPFEATRAVRVTAEDRARSITVVRPQGQSLPAAFLETDWSAQPSYLVPPCLTLSTSRCEAILTDLNGDGIAESILLPTGAGQAVVFRSNDDHSWSLLGNLQAATCTGMREALIAGSFQVAPPAFNELEISGYRLRLSLPFDCRDAAAAAVKAKR